MGRRIKEVVTPTYTYKYVRKAKGLYSSYTYIYVR